MTNAPVHLMGWIDLPGRYAMAASFAPPLAQAAPNLMGADKDVYLFRAWKDVLGDYPHYPPQETGDCTSFGSGHTVDLLQCLQIALDHQAEVYKEVCTEAIYGMGREIAGMLRFGQGCTGAAVSKAVMQGVVPREAVGAYSGQRAIQWGRYGVPQNVKDGAARHPVKAAAMVTTLAELDAALANGYPAIVCSNQGFMMTRDESGVCHPYGSWSHCMSISGRRTKDGRRQYCIDQSWGDNVPSGPTSDDQPSFSFWIDSTVMAAMLAVRDSFAFSSFDGFPGQPLPDHWSYGEWA